MMIAPYIPLPMWCSVGAVPQWYMKMPAYSALNWYTSDSPGWIVRISSFQATWLAWKSIECPIVPSFAQRHREDVADLAPQDRAGHLVVERPEHLGDARSHLLLHLGRVSS